MKHTWYQVRLKLANLFINIGRKIYPDIPGAKALKLQLIEDMLIHGISFTRIDPAKIYNSEPTGGVKP